MSDSFFESSFAKNSKFHWDFIKDFKDKNKWEILAEQYKEKNSLSNKKPADQIPKLIHQIWIGPKPLPEKYKIWMKSWQDLNKDWDYKLWTDQNIGELNFINKDLFHNSKNIGFKSDIARYEILNKFGGLYADTDFECIKKVPDYFRSYEFVSCIVFDNTPVIANGLLMSKPNSFLLSEIINNVSLQKNDNSAMETLKCSGALLITKIYFSLNAEDRNRNLILPSNYFYPLPNFPIDKRTNVNKFINKETIGIHYWEVSWMKKNVIIRIIKRIKKILKSLFKNIF